MEPCMKLYYHGAELKTVGGCNFTKFEKHINRTFHYINHVYTPTGDYNKEYEMPYYKWEKNLEEVGNAEEYESSASFLFIGFRGMYNFRAPPEEGYLTHERMKK
jgi:hypothetical protein